MRTLLLITVLASPACLIGQDGVAGTSDGQPAATAPKVNQRAQVAAEKLGPRIPEGAQHLLSGRTIDPKAWTFVSAKRDAKPAETWSMKTIEGESVLVCSGQPFGLVRTVVEHENFKFGLEWRFPDGSDGNSGVLVHTGTEQTVWPRAIQVQFHQPELGAILPVGGARVATESKRVNVKSKPAGEWNTCVISSKAGALSVEINGVAVGAVTGCEPHRGCLGLQSEGSTVQFRRVWVQPAVEGTSSEATDETAIRPEPMPEEEMSNGSYDLREPVPVSYHWRRSHGRLPLAMAAEGPTLIPVACTVRGSNRARRILSRRSR